MTTERSAKLLGAQTLGLYLDMKRAQLGLTHRDLANAAGCVQSTISNLISGRRSNGFPQDALNDLIAFLAEKQEARGLAAMSEEEKAHVEALNAQMPPMKVPSSSPKKRVEQVQEKPRTKQAQKRRHDPATLLELGDYDKETGCYSKLNENTHTLPTDDMLDALLEKDATRWNTLRYALAEAHPDKKIYLCGFDAQRMDLRAFDLSNCDLTDFKWPINTQHAKPEALSGAALLAATLDAEQNYFETIPAPVRWKFEDDNPDFNIGALVQEARHLIKQLGAPSARVKEVEAHAPVKDAPSKIFAQR